MDYKKTYEDRNKINNKAEDKFEAWCKDQEIEYWHFGFNEKKNRLPKFYTLHSLIRNLPDYIIYSGEKLSYIEIKGTNKVKLKDIAGYRQFGDLFCSDDNELYIGFMVEEGFMFLTLDEIEAKVVGSVVREYGNDKNKFIEVNL